MPLRAAQKTSGRDALASYQRARFDVIVCRTHLGDIVSRHWVRMVRSGKFGYSATPVIVLCDAIELQELGPDWPARLHWLTQELGLAAPEQCLGRRNQLATGVREQLRQLLRTPGSSRAQGTASTAGRPTGAAPARTAP